MKKLLSFGCIFILVGCAVFKTSDSSNLFDSKRVPAGYSESSVETISAESLTFEKLIMVIKNSKSSKVEDALEQISHTYQDYLRSYVLAYNSFSVQQSTFLQPRAIIFGPKAKFIFSFNADPTLSGYNTIETVQFNDANKQFDFREIVFKGDAGENHLENSEIAFEDSNIVVSKINPNRCVLCHSPTLHPIWDKYHLWPGMYSGLDDEQLSQDKTSNAQFEGRFISVKNDIEIPKYAEFWAAQPQSPRYKFLPKNINTNGFSSANTSFSVAITSRYAEKLAKDLDDIKTLKPFRYALLASVACSLTSSNVESSPAIAKQIKQTFPENSDGFKHLKADTYDHQIEQLYHRVGRIKKDLGADNLVFNTPIAVKDLIAHENNSYFNPDISTLEKQSTVGHFLRMEKPRWEVNFRNIVEGQGVDISKWGLRMYGYSQNYTFDSSSDARDLVSSFYEGFGGIKFDETLKGKIDLAKQADHQSGTAMADLCTYVRSKSFAITSAL